MEHLKSKIPVSQKKTMKNLVRAVSLLTDSGGSLRAAGSLIQALASTLPEIRSAPSIYIVENNFRGGSWVRACTAHCDSVLLALYRESWVSQMHERHAKKVPVEELPNVSCAEKWASALVQNRFQCGYWWKCFYTSINLGKVKTVGS